MEHGRHWAMQLSKLIGTRVAHYRREAQLSAQALARRCDALGMSSLTRVVITKLENGHREAVSVSELLVLAGALNVSPADLVFPLGEDPDVEVLPGKHVDPWEAVLWFSGMTAEAGRVPDDAAGVVHLYQLHHVILQEWREGRAAGPSSERLAAAALRTVRADMRKRGLLLPELPSGLTWIDDGDAR